MREATATWQCVLIAWGDRYPVAEINRLVQSVRTQSRGPARFVLLSDRPREGLDQVIRFIETRGLLVQDAA